VFRELRHEIEAYEDFRRYRASIPRNSSLRRDAARLSARLDLRREQLLTRMRRRRTQERRKPAS
jgi:hypothetical protein